MVDSTAIECQVQKLELFFKKGNPVLTERKTNIFSTEQSRTKNPCYYPHFDCFYGYLYRVYHKKVS